MENKTAVQEVFSELEKLHPQLFNVYTTEGKEFINHFHKFLAIEKKQLKKAYNHDRPNLCAYTEGTAFKEYYNETFKN